jgi:hypothetical protein
VDNMEPNNVPLLEEELDQALKSCTSSSPGRDQTHYDFLKQMERPEGTRNLQQDMDYGRIPVRMDQSHSNTNTKTR